MSPARTPLELRPPAPVRKPDAAVRTPAQPPAPAPERPAVVVDGIKVVAWLSLTAGAIHAIAMVDHFSHWWLYGVFFLLLTYGQVLWGASLLRRRPADRTLKLGAYANLAIVAVWVYTRTIGAPLGPEAGSAEPVGSMDVAVVVDQLVLAAYVAVILRPDLRVRRGLKTLLGVHRMRLGMMICSATFFVAIVGGHQH